MVRRDRPACMMSASATGEAGGQPGRDARQRHALLRHRVALADRDGVVVEGLEVDGDAERRADLVLPAVAPADRAWRRRTRRSSACAARRRGRGPSATVGSLRDSGSTAALTGASRGSSRSTVRLSTPPLALGASSSSYASTRNAISERVRPGGRLDDVRRPALALGLVEVRQVGAGVLGVRRQVEVGAVGDALELAPLRAREAEPVLDVDGALRVVGQLLLRVLVVPQVVAARCRGRRTSGSRSSIQYWCHSSSVPGSTKYSISICSNSRVRKMKLPGVISLRNDLPIWPMPNGGFLRDARHAR